MAEPVWGQLEKSQVDNETIEQAIARLIQAHEDDADAHAVAGESLDVHKEQAIIDHPAGSLLKDKISDKEQAIMCDFESLDPWTTVGTVYIAHLGLMRLLGEFGGVVNSSANMSLPFVIAFLSENKTALWQATMAKKYGGLGNWRAGPYYLTVVPDYDGWYFEEIAGVLRAKVKKGGVSFQSDPIAIDTTLYHVYRIQNFPAEDLLKFFIDGVLVWSVDIETDAIWGKGASRFDVHGIEDPEEPDNDITSLDVLQLIYAYDF